MKQTIFISGTPCTGKTTLAENLNYKIIKINELAIENDFVLGVDKDKGYKIIDIDKLNNKVQKLIAASNETIIFEGHFVHLCDGADKVIILRTRPEVLINRLKARNYSDAKINENLEAEAIGICTSEAFEKYENRIFEIDVSDLTISDMVKLVENIIDSKVKASIGEIDFMEWLLSNN